MEIHLTVLGKPMGKGRPQFARYGNFTKTFTPEKTTNYENLVRLTYQEKYQNISFERNIPLSVDIKAYFAIPKGLSKKKQALYETETVLFKNKPDWDNIAKICCDSLNGLAYYDDNQISVGKVTKLYGKVPRVEITINSIEEEN